MKPRIKLGSATTQDGSELELIQHDRDFLLVVNGEVLMSTRVKNSEEELAQLALNGSPSGARVLVGGLGMGFTLRATLDLLDCEAEVVQAELLTEVVEWNKGALGQATGHPVNDPRAKIVVRHVAQLIREHEAHYDAILLDVDNGPTAMVTSNNQQLYSRQGLEASLAALKPGGNLAIWSANDDRQFAALMRSVGFWTTVHRVRGTGRRKGPTHVIFVGTKQDR